MDVFTFSTQQCRFYYNQLLAPLKSANNAISKGAKNHARNNPTPE